MPLDKYVVFACIEGTCGIDLVFVHQIPSQVYGSDESLLTTPRGSGRRPSPLRSARAQLAAEDRYQNTYNKYAERHCGSGDLGKSEQTIMLFVATKASIVNVLADLKAMEDMIDALQGDDFWFKLLIFILTRIWP